MAGPYREYESNPARGLSLTRELRWASETGSVLLNFAVAGEFRGIVEERSEVEGGPISFIPVRGVPDRSNLITVQVLIAVWLVVECGSVTVDSSVGVCKVLDSSYRGVQ